MDILFYLLKNIVATALLLGVYMWMLRDSVKAGAARVYLLSSVIISAVVPVLSLPAPVSSVMQVFSLPDVLIGQWRTDVVGSYIFATYRTSVISFYLVGVFCFVAWLCIESYQLVRLLRKGKIDSVTPSYTVLTQVGAGPGSIGKYIFFPGGAVDETILQHEMCHVVRRHTADILFLRLMRCVLWPNFLLSFVMRELKMVHEYEADEAALRTTPDYGMFLLNEVLGTTSFSLSNSFFSHPIKRRIVMLQKSKMQRGTTRNKLWTAATAGLLMMAGMVYVQSCRPAATVTEPTKESKAAEMHHADDKITMPEAKVDLVAFLSANIKYPDAAKAKKITGRVVVKLIIDETGRLVETEVKRSPDELLSAEALRVIGQIPGWKPGTKKGVPVKTELYLPVSFVL